MSLSHANSSSLHGRTLCSRIFTTALLALSSQRVAAFSPVQNVDFAACYDYLVALNASSLNDPALYHLWDSNHTFYQDPRQLVLTLPGCEHVCGDGWQLWPILYVLDHFSLRFRGKIMHSSFSTLLEIQSTVCGVCWRGRKRGGSSIVPLGIY